MKQTERKFYAYNVQCLVFTILKPKHQCFEREKIQMNIKCDTLGNINTNVFKMFWNEYSCHIRLENINMNIKI